MTLNYGEVIGNAFNDTFSGHTSQLAVIALIFMALFHVGFPLLTDGVTQQTTANTIQYTASSIVVLAATLAFYIIFGIGLIRSLYHRDVKTEYFTHDLGITAANTIVGGIITGVAISLGFLVFVIPGLILLSSLYLWAAHVILDDENFLDAFKDSWHDTKGNRGTLIGIIITAWVLSLSVSFVAQFGAGVFSLAFYNTRVQAVALLAIYYVGIYVSIFNASILVETYRALTD
jgi:hypothetical protein